MASHRKTTVGQYLVTRLAQAGVGHAFGVAGDYVLDLLDLFASSPVRLVTTSSELGAGYAADGYARLNGVGALVVTYGVGGLSAVNAVAGAYAERVPLIVVSGAPNTRMWRSFGLLHHMVGCYELQREVYEKLTVCAVTLGEAGSAPAQIDRAISACLRLKRPVYIEVPVDLVSQPCEAPANTGFDDAISSAAGALAEAVEEAAAMLREAKAPAVLVGLEVRRFKLQEKLVALLEKGGFPVTTTIGGKSALAETYEHYAGVYQGGFTHGVAHDTTEGADCLLCLGAWMTDITTGGFTAHLDANRMISANSDRVRIRHHLYEQVCLGDFITKLTEASATAALQDHAHQVVPYQAVGAFVPQRDTPLTVARFFARVNHFLTGEMNVVTDTGDVMFGATELHLRVPESFISQDFYLSIGYALPAALGVSLAAPARRAVVFTGDGALQMTAAELGTFPRVGAHPIVFVLNNDGYVIERLIHDGPYNEIGRWQYRQLPEALRAGLGLLVRTEGELEEALALAARTQDQLVLIELQVDRRDSTETLRHVAENIRHVSRQ